MPAPSYLESIGSWNAPQANLGFGLPGVSDPMNLDLSGLVNPIGVAPPSPMGVPGSTTMGTAGVPGATAATTETPETKLGLWGEGGFSMDKLGTLFKGISSLGSVWAGVQANKIAGESLDFQKDAFNKNFANQLQSYNTALSDRAKARYAQEGGTEREANRYIRKNKLRG